jgi:hypothetical protein
MFSFDDHWLIFWLILVWAFVIWSFINFLIFEDYYAKNGFGLQVSFFHN